MNPHENLTPDKIAPLVLLIRGERVLLDSELARLYGVETRALKQAVRRNLSRFPADFLFELTREEARELARLRSQTVILKPGRHIKYLPYAFTEQGVAMLSSVLRSPDAVAVNIAIMRTFVQLRRLMDSNRELARKIESMEDKYDQQFRVVFEAIKRLIAEQDARKAKSPREIGFHVKEDTVPYRAKKRMKAGL